MSNGTFVDGEFTGKPLKYCVYKCMRIYEYSRMCTDRMRRPSQLCGPRKNVNAIYSFDCRLYLKNIASSMVFRKFCDIQFD